jgi:hypothetical protein
MRFRRVTASCELSQIFDKRQIVLQRAAGYLSNWL